MNPVQSARPAMPGLRLNNIALAVENLDAMIAWYETTLGLNVAERGQFDAVGANYAMLDGAGVRLELVSRTGTSKRPVDRTAPPVHLDVLGWKALVLESDDLSAATAWLIEQRADVVWADMPLSATMRSTLIRDPEGNLINVLGRAS